MDDALKANNAHNKGTLSLSIVLVGMMGCGKSSVGVKLAQSYDIPFVDSDRLIECHYGMHINDIFDRHGESEFRRQERILIAKNLDHPPHVLSVGGGAFLDPSTRKIMDDKALSVWLKINPDSLFHRLKSSRNRPLLTGNKRRARVAELCAQRYPIYALADYTVEANQTPTQVIDDIRRALPFQS